MNILWFSWKDIRHPQAGGAETVSNEIMKRLVRDGHQVTLVTSGYASSGEEHVHDGVRIFYVGNRYSVYPAAKKLYMKKLRGWDDFVVDEMNTLPFLAGRYTSAPNKVLLAYQLAREVWFYQMIFPLSVVGYLIEPLYLFATSRVYKKAVTESESTVHDMKRFGFYDVKTFSIGMGLEPLKRLPKKASRNVVLSLGAVRPMKRTTHVLRAFELARDTEPSLELVIAGDVSSNYAKKLIRYVEKSRHTEAISIKGRVSQQERLSLMRSAGVIVVTSVKEGWGLIVTEANSQGTPAVAYDVDGLRDSISDTQTGLLSPSGDIAKLAQSITSLISSTSYELVRSNAWQSSKLYSFEESYLSFLRAAELKRDQG